MFQIPNYISRLLIASVVGAVFSGSVFAQPEALREAIEERLDRGDLPSNQIPIAKKIIKDISSANTDIPALVWDVNNRPSVFEPEDVIVLLKGKIDVEGSLILLGFYFIDDLGETGLFIIKYDSKGLFDWIELYPSEFGSIASKIVIDIDGNIYLISNQISSIAPNHIAKISPRGSLRWDTDVSSSTANDIKMSDVLVDEDGNIYVAGEAITNGVKMVAIHRYRPDGVLLWEKLFALGDVGENTTVRSNGFAIDRVGQVRFVATVRKGGILQNAIGSVNPSGELNWTTYFPRESFTVGPVLDKNCNAYIADFSGFAMNVRGFSSDGDLLYSVMATDAMTAQGAVAGVVEAFSKIVVDLDGRVHVATSTNRALIGDRYDQVIGIAQISPEGSVVDSIAYLLESYNSGSSSLVSLDVDRFGNPYFANNYVPFSGMGGSAIITKLDKNNLAGGAVWDYTIENVGGSDVFSLFDMFVDFGDNIFFVGSKFDTIPLPPTLRIGKLSQPFIAVPIIAQNSPNLQIHNQSLWGEFVGGVSSYTEFFQINHAQTQFNIGIDETFSIFPFGDFGGSVDFAGSMALGMGFEATASGGVVNIDYPGNLEIIVPGSDKLSAGSVFTITSQFDAHSSGNVVSDATPVLSAGLKANVALNISSGAELIAFSDSIATIPLVNANPSWEGLVPGLSMSVPTGNPGSWVEFGDERNIVTGRLTRPLFSSNGGIDLSTGIIRSDLKPEVFFSLRGNLTNYISTYQLGVPTIYSINSGSTSAWALGASVNFAQAFAEIKLEANQSLTFEPTVTTLYEFYPLVDIHLADGEVLTDQGDYELTMTLEGSQWTGSFDISVSSGELIGSNGSVTITPKSRITSTLHNRTWVDIQPSVGWETLAAEAHAEAFGENLFGFEFCVLCFNFPLTDDLPINLFDSTLNLPTTEVELDPIVFLIEPNGNPRISGTSRARLSAFIYDQVSADPFELAAFINSPAKKMLIYGDKFLSTNEEPLLDHVVLCSQGRVVELPTTILNSRTALVEIPNSMRLVPGIARIWAVSTIPGEQGSSISETIDFPIELPIPNLGTAGPNLWAADPRLSNLAIDVIDGLTPSRTASFIARRDYWYVLADMWDAIDAGNGTGLFESYPIYDFTAEPPMPAVLIKKNGVPQLDGVNHTWAFDGDFTDSVGSADGTPIPTAQGFVTEGVPPLLGQAVVFDGDQNDLDWIELDPTSLTDIGTNDFSVVFWAKQTDPAFPPAFAFDSQGGKGHESFLQVAFQSGTGLPVIGFRDEVGGFSVTLTGSGDISMDNGWHHYAFTANRQSSTGLRLYFDGVLDGTEDLTSQQQEFFFGEFINLGILRFSNGAYVAPMKGQIGDFSIFNRALSASEVFNLSNPNISELPIGRFKQPVENGILYSLMPKSEYDEPKLVSISLDVAGPGGGKSNSIDLTVAAPQPVVSNLIPRSIFPEFGEFVLTVEGPLSVPFFNGFEEERFGNFNKASVVLWDGIPLATTYVTPGTLEAVVPAGLTMLRSDAGITVQTPSNGTGYFNSFTGGIVESGGESNLLVLEVRYPTPIITAMSPELTSKAIIDRCPDNPGTVRLTITGESFWPGATIWIDGVEHVTTVQSSNNRLILSGVVEEELSYNVIFTELDIVDLSRLYSAPVKVMNPDGTFSDRVFLEIVDEAAYEAYYGVVLPPQLMPGECK